MKVTLNKTVHYPGNHTLTTDVPLEGEILNIDDSSIYVKVKEFLFRIMFQDISFTEFSNVELDKWISSLTGFKK